MSFRGNLSIYSLSALALALAAMCTSVCPFVPTNLAVFATAAFNSVVGIRAGDRDRICHRGRRLPEADLSSARHRKTVAEALQPAANLPLIYANPLIRCRREEVRTAFPR